MEELLKKLINDFGDFRQEVNQRFGGLEQKFDDLEQRFDGLEQRFDVIEPLVIESHKWIRAMSERQEVQNAELNNQGFRLAKVEGALKGSALSLQPLIKAE